MKYLIKFSLFVFFYSCHQVSSPVGENTAKIKEKSIVVEYSVNPRTSIIDFFWKDKNGNIIENAKRLNQYMLAQGRELKFSVNGGMYLRDQSPQGLYVENGLVKKRLDTIQSAYGNFYMQPNGVFYITNSNEAKISKSVDFRMENVKYATQSGPMLLVNGDLHYKFQENSSSKYIRNGVGILPNGDVLFLMSKETINFYDFAMLFKNRGCTNALYLDGFVSRTYLPSKKWVQEDGNFGVMIGVTKTLD